MHPDPEAQLESFLEELPPNKRMEAFTKFVECVDEILGEYSEAYESAKERFEAALYDQEQYAQEFGETRWSALVDQFVLQALWVKTLH